MRDDLARQAARGFTWAWISRGRGEVVDAVVEQSQPSCFIAAS